MIKHVYTLEGRIISWIAQPFRSFVTGSNQSCRKAGQKLFIYTNLQILTISTSANYSVLKLFTGLAIAALTAWKLTLNNAMTIDTIPPIKNNHQVNCIL